jgi:putative restriction endonuclease
LDTDLSVRVAAFSWLAEKTESIGDVLPRSLLAEGLRFDGNRVPLVGPQGIFKPRILSLPLTITSTSKNPYKDNFSEDGLLSYRYRGTDPNHLDNIGLRKVFEQQRPLIYFYGMVPGQYLAIWPVYVVNDNPLMLTFTIAVDDMTHFFEKSNSTHLMKEESETRRKYITGTVKIRLHQRGFRERVLYAYRTRCAICQLHHRELLDAAHIIPDSDPAGEPLITNGISLCKLHHAAFDNNFLGVSPDFAIHIRQDILDEQDGPILQHGLKELDGIRILLPRDERNWPDRLTLDFRYEQFLKSS